MRGLSARAKAEAAAAKAEVEAARQRGQLAEHVRLPPFHTPLREEAHLYGCIPSTLATRYHASALAARVRGKQWLQLPSSNIGVGPLPAC